MNLLNGGAADDLARTLSVLDMHLEEYFDDDVETATSKSAEPRLGLMKDGVRKPARTDNTIGTIDELHQFVERARRRSAVGINITDHVRGGCQLEPFNQCAAFADGVRKIKGADGRVFGTYF